MVIEIIKKKSFRKKKPNRIDVYLLSEQDLLRFVLFVEITVPVTLLVYFYCVWEFDKTNKMVSRCFCNAHLNRS